MALSSAKERAFELVTASGWPQPPPNRCPDLVFEEGMTVVVQPNVVTTDERAGVQTGGLVLVTRDGIEPLQQAPRGFWRAG